MHIPPREQFDAILGGQNHVAASGRNDCSYLAADQISRKCWQSLALVFRKPVFDRDIATIHDPPPCNPRRNASTQLERSWRPKALRNPTTGMANCCARAASGHAAAPPRSVMNWRRFH